ncbi:uncharacterized protein CELE_C03C10.7 [Caenorhabditis elegans]|uniref:Uncharacterized protein n=1 Tax=Caenorhabditis elegans TaxID=6239 RepID=Q7YX72_CAEEL|nr:Uncharacterized protein CELE_C03C10.7 [Caenorhabditis elegans]CAE17723.1 Uncharacterized protein CELE_C03C10.7 [Caenorhabditis elegans]|eukprot:NP_001021140.1 Uncharacterized protein CELE_C03C10.7 [Caenorhabditis elegans]
MASDRRFSVTLSEDDLRPHLRKPKPLKPPKPQQSSEIEELIRRNEKREEAKKEVKRRIEEEEKAKEQRKRDEEIRRETHELLVIRELSNNRNDIEMPSIPKLGRRVNNFQYFKWDSDEEIPIIPEERRPASVSRLPPATRASTLCELCTLASRLLDKSSAPTRSAACAHVDAFVGTSSSSHYHNF